MAPNWVRRCGGGIASCLSHCRWNLSLSILRGRSARSQASSQIDKGLDTMVVNDCFFGGGPERTDSLGWFHHFIFIRDLCSPQLECELQVFALPRFAEQEMQVWLPKCRPWAAPESGKLQWIYFGRQGVRKRLLRLAMWQWSRRLLWGVHVSEVHVAGRLPESEVEPDSAQYALDSFGFRLRCPPCFQANLLKSATSDLFDMDFTTLQKLQKYSEVAFGLLRPRSGYLVSRLRDFQNPSNTKHSDSSSPKIGRTSTAWLCQSCNACWGRGDIQHFGKRLGEAGPG